MYLEKFLEELTRSDQPLSVSRLKNLSALSREELALFERAWPGIEVKRRRQILEELMELSEYNAELDFEDVYRIALSDEDEEVRSEAIEALWECDDRSLIDPLVTLMRQDRSEKVRATATGALGKFALLSEFGELRPRDTAKVVAALLSAIEEPGESAEVRRRAIEAISPLSRPQVQEIIRQAYRSADPRLKGSAIYAMGRNCDPIWLPILIAELSSDDPEMRYEAALACAELEDELAVPQLILLAYDEDDQVQAAAIATLGRIGGNEARRELERLLGDSRERVRQAAEEALEEMEFQQDPLSFRHEI